MSDFYEKHKAEMWARVERIDPAGYRAERRRLRRATAVTAVVAVTEIVAGVELVNYANYLGGATLATIGTLTFVPATLTAQQSMVFSEAIRQTQQGPRSEM